MEEFNERIAPNNESGDLIEYSIVIPVYNSSQTLNELIEEIKLVFKKLNSAYEIIMVDDCSNDNCWERMKELHKKDNNIKIIHLIKNFGQHNATLCGFNHCNGKYVITIDDDLQHPPEEILKLIEKIKEGYLVVYGKYKSKNENLLRDFLSRKFQKIIHEILLLPDDIFLSSFAIYHSNVVKNMIKIKSSYPFILGLMAKSAPVNKIANVKVLHNERKAGNSNYTIIKYFKYSLNLIINYSSLPLTIIAIIGSLVSFLSLSYGSMIIIKSLTDSSYGIIGWNSLMVAVTFLGGMTLLSLGIVGEYLRRILTEVSYGQQYAIDEIHL
ncbi:glycosyltransferase family 2 protein [Methanoplanus limicola]|uniref:Glycosyl transferase family 2 n=1 Tax=Methanoplanus limicola DSM 2279 TaxID=937775 RepID=H1Z1X3_9EURY|nr:glycosyltransferase family 2 protein [Methanoplanus limicola]EHQ35440.1 glycosyl transferase family 2 [Methanoplanus limicola DSM 2279]